MKIRFGDHTLDTDSRQLWRSGSAIHLSPKAFDLLKLLVERRPSAISKSELHERIWPGTFVSDDSLSRLIVEVREATGDDARRPRFVRTLHGFGYAFSAEAETISDPDGSDSSAPPETDEEKRIDADRTIAERPTASKWTWTRGAAGAAVLGVFLIGALVASRDLWKDDDNSRPISFVVLPPEGTALSSSASLVAISPNGAHIAFVAVSDNGRRSLWARSLESVAARELPGTDDALSPFWSPDSSAVGFFANGKLKKIDLAGGLPEGITDTDVATSFAGTWNRHGSILFGGDNTHLFLVSASGGTPRAVTSLDKAKPEI
jgi:DNA-binding winged helix-turn-helix (wHTH) protein